MSVKGPIRYGDLHALMCFSVCIRQNCYVNLLAPEYSLPYYYMKIATLFFIVGMLLMFLFFKTSFVSASQETVDFHIHGSNVIISKTHFYLYLTLFFISLFLTGLLVSKRIHKVKRDK